MLRKYNKQLEGGKVDWNRLKRLYKDEDIVELMNTMAVGDSPAMLPYTQKGGYLPSYQATSNTLPKDVHNAADRAGISWDNDPNFMDLSERITGKRHIDKMTPEERRRLINSFAHGGEHSGDDDPKNS